MPTWPNGRDRQVTTTGSFISYRRSRSSE